jgi:hypothetical protein
VAIEPIGPAFASFRFIAPGQPPSLNSTYRIVRIKHRDGTSHQQMAKRPDVETYQVMVSSLVRRAMPHNWNPPGQIRIRYWFHVQRAIDADNTLKAINDAIELGMGTKIVGRKVVPLWNDSLFLPCVQELTTKNKEPYVEIEVSYAV